MKMKKVPYHISQLCKLGLISSFGLTMVACGGGGGGGGGEEDSPTPPPKAALQLVSPIGMPENIIADGDGVMEVKISNPIDTAAQLHKIAGAAVSNSGSSITIFGVIDQTTKKGQAQVDLLLNNQNAEVGANKACWNGNEGAQLQPGESCSQYLVASGEKDAAISGGIKFTAITEDKQTLSVDAKISANFQPPEKMADDSVINIAEPIEFRPNYNMSFTVNNPSNQAFNGAYIDLSEVPESLLNSIDWTQLQGGIYYAPKKKIIIPRLEAGSSQTISTFITGNAKESLDDPATQQRLSNNQTSDKPMIKAGSASASGKTTPPAKAQNNPFDTTQETIKLDDTLQQDNFIFEVPHKSGKLIFSELLRENVPDSITIEPSMPLQSSLKAGDVLSFSVIASADTPSGLYQFTAVFADNSGKNYSKQFTIDINATTELKARQDMVVLLKKAEHSSTTGRYKKAIDLVNIGRFDAQLHKLDDQFSVSGGGILLEDDATTPCSGTVLKPKQSCKIWLYSDMAYATDGIYSLKTIQPAADSATSKTLAYVSLQTSPFQLGISMDQGLPEKIGVGESVSFKFSFVNDDKFAHDIKVKDLIIPASLGSGWDCSASSIAKGDTISVNPSVNDTYVCSNSFSKPGEALNGVLEMKFNYVDDYRNPREFSYSSMPFNLEVVAQENLPKNLRLQEAVSLAPGGQLRFKIKNDSFSSVQGIKLDLSGLPPEIYSKLSLVSDPVDVKYDQSTGLATVETPMFAQSTKELIFDLPLSAEVLNALVVHKTDIESNPSSHLVTLSSLGNQAIYPSFNVMTDVLQLQPANVDYSTPGVQNITFKNTTPESLDFRITDLPAGVSITAPRTTIKPGEMLVISMSAKDKEVSPGDYTAHIVLTTPSGEEVPLDFHITIANPVLSMVNSNLQLARPDVAGSSTTLDVALVNQGGSNQGFSIWGVTSTSDAFEIKNSAGATIAPSKFEITDATTGASITQGIAYGAQAVIQFKLNDPSLSSGKYALWSTAVGNLLEQKIGSFEVGDAQNQFTVTRISSIPSFVLTGEKLSYKATLQNITAKPLTVVSVSAPDGTNYDATEPGVNGNLWDGHTGLTLQPGEKASLSFDATLANAGDNYKGDLIIYTQDEKGSQEDDYIESFDTTAKSSLSGIDTGDEPWIIASGETHVTITSPEGFNNLYLDLSKMPLDLYAQIKRVRFNDTMMTLPASPAKIPLGYAAIGENKISIAFSESSVDLLKNYKETLEDNANTQMIVIGAANAAPTTPEISVSPNSVMPDSMNATIMNPDQPYNIVFTNLSDMSVTIDQPPVITALPQGVTMSKNNCSGVLISKGTCTVTLTASKAAYGEGTLELPYSSSGVLLKTSVAIQVAKPAVDVENITMLNIPLQGNTNTKIVSIENTGNFTLQAFNGRNLYDFISLRDKNKPDYLTLTGDITTGSYQNQKCLGKKMLSPGDKCYVKLSLDYGSGTTQTQQLRFTAGANNNAQEDATDDFNLVGNGGQISFMSSQDKVISELRLAPTQSYKSTITLKNVGTTMMLANSAVSFAWDQGTASGAADPVINSAACNNKGLSTNQTCTITISGNTQDPALSGELSGSLSVNSDSGHVFKLPVKMRLGHQWKALATSFDSEHNCAIDMDDQLYCWGKNVNGQLGDGTTTNRSSPTKVLAGSDGFTSDKVKSVSVGRFNTCAITMSDKLYCWGANGNGQLGLNDGGSDLDAKKYPVAVRGVFGLQNAQVVSVGARHVCATSTLGNQLYCWGDNRNLQLGSLKISDDSKIWDDSGVTDPSPVTYSTGPVVYFFAKQVAAGNNHTCATNLNNKLYCWGQQEGGKLGNAATAENKKSTPIAVVKSSDGQFNPNNVSQIAISPDHTCAINNNKLYCFGSNEEGQLGTKYTSQTGTPVKTDPPNGFTPHAVLQVASGGAHTCAQMDDPYYTYCWGRNTTGQLGMNVSTDTQYTNYPVKFNYYGVLAREDVKQLTAMKSSSCILTNYNEIYCWGPIKYGQLGNGEMTSASYDYWMVPKALKDPS